MARPLVTVFIPLYNAENYIKETLASILNQTYQNLEILLVDDGSIDRSIQIVKSFDDERIRLIQNGENKGIPYTRNIGLAEAKGKYLAVMDSDDLAYLTRIEKQVEYMEQHPDIDVLGSFYETFGGKVNRVIEEEFYFPEEIKIALLFFSPIANPSSIIRLETVKQHHIRYNQRYFVSQDYDMWVQLSKVGKLYILPEILLKYRTGHLNITKKSKTKKAEQRRAIIHSIHEDVLTHYGFQLTPEELAAFNAFFTDNPVIVGWEVFEKIPDVLVKMVQQNRRKSMFTESLFETMIQKIFFRYLCNQKLSLLDKIRLYHRVRLHKNRSSFGKDVSYIILKHTYQALQS